MIAAWRTSLYNTFMSTTFEADVALIHIAGGSSRTTTPPGSIAQAAPRRAARGRSDDLLFLNLSLHPDRTAAPGLTAHLSHLGADAYYGTPGSVTLGLRESAAIINDHLMDANQAEMISSKLQGRLMAGLLRGNNFYATQCGPGQVVLIRPDKVTHFTSEEASRRTLGIASVPTIRYHHFEVQLGDIIIITTAEPPIWADPLLAGLAGLNPAQAIDRLTPDIERDLIGMVIGIAAPGEATKLPRPSSEIPSSDVPKPTASSTRRRATKTPAEPSIARGPSRMERFARGLQRGIRSILSSIAYSFTKTLARLSPGLAEPTPGMFSPKLLTITAITVPLVVVAIGSLVYFRIGRERQFQLDLADARTAIADAESMQGTQARAHWEEALFWLDEAARYGTSNEWTELHEKVQSTLDQLDLIVRLDFRQVVSGGFGPEAHISALAASGSDVYALDETHNTIWHIWSVGRGYEIDGEFMCVSDVSTQSAMSTLVDIAIVPEPSALGVESVIGIDKTGGLIYCAPDKIPTTTELTPAELDWGKIQAFEVYNDRLYLLDVAMNTIVIYNAANGFITGNPESYFLDQAPDLSGAIDIVGTQDGLLILYADSHLDLCNRQTESETLGDDLSPSGCESLPFKDERSGHEEEQFSQIPGALPIEVEYSPPPEPSLFFQDAMLGGIYQYSMRMIYQTTYLPLESFPDEVTAFAIGQPNHIYVAAGNQVYHAQFNQ
jgi:hypothetical protein